MRVRRITAPLDTQTVKSLRAGDQVLISGTIYSARDMAHKRLCQAIERGEKLPFELQGAVIYYMGPTPAAPGRVIGSAGPTTSGRMDKYAPLLYAKGVCATIGKGYRSQEVRLALAEYGAVHFSATGGAGAYLSMAVKQCEVIAYQDLGAEAIRRLVVEEFPATVAYDSFGASIYPQRHEKA